MQSSQVSICSLCFNILWSCRWNSVIEGQMSESRCGYALFCVVMLKKLHIYCFFNVSSLCGTVVETKEVKETSVSWKVPGDCGINAALTCISWILTSWAGSEGTYHAHFQVSINITGLYLHNFTWFTVQETVLFIFDWPFQLLSSRASSQWAHSLLTKTITVWLYFFSFL